MVGFWLALVEMRSQLKASGVWETDHEEVGVKYVTTFVHPVKKNKMDVYLKTARKFAKLWKEHGALSVTECVADDVKPGKQTSFPQSVNLKRTETVAISWVTFKSRAHRDKVMAAVMGDPRAQKLMNPTDMPSDGHRMFWGGFDAKIIL